jgi:hypothetical protein
VLRASRHDEDGQARKPRALLHGGEELVSRHARQIEIENDERRLGLFVQEIERRHTVAGLAHDVATGLEVLLHDLATVVVVLDYQNSRWLRQDVSADRS